MYANPNRGFIALMSAVIISAVLMLVVVSGGLTGFFSRSNVFDREAKERSSELAAACAEIVVLRLAYDKAFEGPETITIGSDECQVIGVEDITASPRVYQTKGVFHRANTNLRASVDVELLSVIAIQEIETF